MDFDNMAPLADESNRRECRQFSGCVETLSQQVKAVTAMANVTAENLRSKLQTALNAVHCVRFILCIFLIC